MLYIFDQDENLIALLKPDFGRSTGPATISRAFLSAEYPAEFDRQPTEGCPYWDAIHHEVLNGENTFQFTVPGNQSDAAYVAEGNLASFKDLDAAWQFFEIKRMVDKHGDGLTRTAYCEHILYELLDDIVNDKRPAAGATAALSGMLENTRWTVGIVDDLGTHSTTAYYENALSAVQKVADAWDGELQFRCVVTGGVISRYCDLLAARGTDTGKQFAYSKDIITVEREVDSSGVVTALYGRGKGVETEAGETYGRRLTFADVVWTTAGGDPCDKPAGQEWVGDSAALALWGRSGSRHRYDVFTDDDETNTEALLQSTWNELQTRTTPRTNYKLDVVSLEELIGYEHEAIRIGDLVRVIDREFTPELIVSARVIELERDLLSPENTKVTLGSYAPTIIDANINNARQVSKLANKPFNTSWLDGKISVLQNEIENTTAFVFQTKTDGILIMDAATFATATKALKLGGGIFALANSKTGDVWNWRTFGDGAGFTGDEILANTIKASSLLADSAMIEWLNARQIVAGSVKAEDIDTTTALITAAKIETLAVGTNVSIGTAEDATGVTTIIGNTVTTDFINALNVKAGSVDAEDITGTTITGKTIQTALSDNDRIVFNTSGIIGYNANNQKAGLEITPGYSDLILNHSGSEIFKVYNDVGTAVRLYMDQVELLSYNINLQKMYPKGSWDFSSCTVSGLTNVIATAVFG